MPLVMATERQALTAQRFRVIIRGDNFLVPDAETDGETARVGFYVVRTTVAENVFTAGKLALFDFETELHLAQQFDDRFLETGALAVEEVRPLRESEEDVASGFILYPMT